MKYTDQELKNIIISLIKDKPNSYVVILKNKFNEIHNLIINKYPLLINHPMSEYYYWFLNNLNSFPICKNENCNNTTKFINGKTGYLDYCSLKCSATCQQAREKYRKTCIKKYGVDHPCKSQDIIDKIQNTNLKRYRTKCSLQNEEVQKKTKSTNLKRYGTEYALQNKKVLEKLKNTNLQRYGVECTLQNDDVKNKNQATNLKRYGTKNAAQSEYVKNKTKKTNLERYSVEYPIQSPIIHQKIKNTNLKKYGVDNSLKSKEIRDKIKNTNLERYGVENVWGAEEIIEKIKNTVLNKYGVKTSLLKTDSLQKSINTRRELAYLNNVITEFDEPLFTKEFFIENYHYDLLLKFKCKQCGNIFESKHHDGYHSRCVICYPKNIISKPELDLSNFIKLYAKIIENNRKIIKPFELDIYVLEKKLAIEFNGLYWHSEINGVTSLYHLNKTKLCEEKGIQLIHIFENEWLFKQNIVKSRLKNILGIHDKTVFARKCEVKEITSKESMKFQEENHIQGAVRASIHLGLFYEDELISLMTFGKTRFSKKYEYELLRFCNKLNYHIPGGAGKLLKYFEKNYNPKSLVSYADRRWSQGKLYEALGFELSHKSAPNYWYWNNHNILESRVKYQKHKLEKLLEKFDPNKTEVENMKDNGYNRIFDCGNLVFTKFF